jgi:hypothetical protein
LKSGRLNLLEPSEPVLASTGIAVPLYFNVFKTDRVSNLEGFTAPYFPNSRHCQMF